MKPLIGISTRLRPLPSSSGDQPAHTVVRLYTDAVRAAGGIATLIPPHGAAEAEQVLDRLDALLLTGGGDVSAALYGRDNHSSMYEIDPERDRFEVALVREAAQKSVPLLAICRGAQVLNVAMGGDLLVDIPSEVAAPVAHFVGGDDVFVGHQRLRLEPGSRLAQLLGTTELLVNSMHHQSVRRLGEGLRAVAWAEDGVVEAIEPTDGEWACWGVQWHPECLSGHDPAARRLFEALVAAAAKRSSP